MRWGVLALEKKEVKPMPHIPFLVGIGKNLIVIP
jgi:hypothetical protein